MYRSPLTRGFFEFVARAGLRYGVLSDLYGIHLDREELPPYDVHPSTLNGHQKRALGERVGSVVRQEGFREVVFYNSSPIRSVPYFQILSHSGLNVFFTTRLPEVETS